jgi:hypothetical protein
LLKRSTHLEESVGSSTTAVSNNTNNTTTTTEKKPLFSFLIKFKKSTQEHHVGIKKYRIGRGNRIIIEEH